MQIYAAPQYRRTPSGWAVVDPSLVATTNPSVPVTAPGALRPISFGASAAQLVQVNLDGGVVTFSAPGLSVGAPTVNGNTVTYHDVAPEADLTYSVSNGAMKEAFHLRSANAPTQFTFTIADPGNALGGVERESDGSYRFRSRIDGEASIVVPPAVAYEEPAAPKEPAAVSAGSAHLAVTPTTGGYSVTESVDPAWLQGKTFPVVLDPTIQFPDANSTLVDGYTASDGACGSVSCSINTSDTNLVAGTNNYVYRSVMQFDVSKIPQDATVSGAGLGVYTWACLDPQTGTQSCPSNIYTVDTYELTGPWTTSTTWDQLQQLQGASSNGYVSSTSNLNALETMEVTSMVQSWVSGSTTNNGLELRMHNEGLNLSGPVWYSDRATNTSLQPFLQVTYSEGSPTASELLGDGNPSEPPVTCATSWGVNCATGNYTRTFRELSIPGRGVPLDFSLTYNSQSDPADTSTALQFGWVHSYGMRLVTNGDGSATVFQENGSAAPFLSNGTGGFTTPGQVRATLTHNADGTYSFFRRTDLITFLFNSAGWLLSETDRNGYATTLSYVTDPTYGQQLHTVTDPEGRSFTLTYEPAGTNGAGEVQSVADSTGRTVSFGYGSSAPSTALTDITDVNGGDTHIGYTVEPSFVVHVTGITDPNGAALTQQFDCGGACATSGGRTFKYSYTSAGTTITDPDGNVTLTQSSGNNELAVLTRGYGTPQAATWSYAYDPSTMGVTSVKDPDSHTTTNTYDANGNLLTHTDARGRQTTYTYNAFDEVLTETDPLRVTTTYTYDAHGNLTSSSRPLTGTSQTATTTYAYDPARPGDLIQVTDPDGRNWKYAYDSNGDRVQTVDPLGNTATAGYDPLGRVTSSVSPNGNVAGANPTQHTSAYTYDPFGDLTTVADPLGHKTSYTYDGDRNLTSLTDPDGNLTHYGYDSHNELTTVTRADGSIERSGYDATGNLTSQTDGLGNATTYTYDPLNRRSKVTDPLQVATNYGYDGAGNLTTVTDPQGHTTTYGYDAANELDSVTYSDGATPNVSAISYDADGERTAMTDGTGTSTWTYDSLHRLTGYTNGSGAAVAYDYRTAAGGYDLLDQVGHITYPNGAGTVTRSYDAAGQLGSITDWNGTSVTFGYDADGNVKSSNFPGAVVDSRTYNRADQIGTITSQGSGGTALAATYAQDANGQITSDTSATAPVDAYRYTPLNQLCYAASSSTNACATPPAGSTTYNYDAGDNPATFSTAATGPVTTATQAFNAADELCWTIGGASSNGCPSPPASATTYAFDNRGNRTQTAPPNAAATCYAYDQSDRLTTVQAGTGAGCGTGTATVAGYSYDGTGLRMAKTVAGLRTQFAWDESGSLPQLLQETADGVSTSYIYGPGSQPVEQLVKTASPPSDSAGRSVWNATSTSSYQLQGNNGSTWVQMDGSKLSLTITPTANSVAVLSANADLFTSVANVNQDLGITVNGGNPVVWKESGGYSSYKPAAVFAQTTYAMSAGTAYTVSVSWKTNVVQPSGSFVRAGAGTSAPYSPTILSAVLTPTSKSLVASAVSSGATQFTTASSSWAVMDSSLNTTFTAATSGQALLTANADVFTARSGTNQDVGICVAPAASLSAGCSNGTVVAWAENGGAPAYMPIAALVEAVYPVSANAQYTVGIVWRASGGGGTIYAGAGGGPYSASSTVAQISPSPDNEIRTASTTSQLSRTESQSDNGTAWAGMSSSTQLTFTASTEGVGYLGANSSLFANSGSFNVDLGVCVAVGSGPCTTAGWKESGSATAYSPDAAFLQVPYAISAGTTYTVKLEWRTNANMPSGTAVFAGAGSSPYSPTTLSVLLAPSLPPSPLYYHQDQLGSTRALTDATGRVQAQYQYDPYGNLYPSSGVVTNSLRFAGEYQDQETGLYYLRARYYDPATGQFLSRDPAVSATRAPYTYALNDPVNDLDPSGLECAAHIQYEGILRGIVSFDLGHARSAVPHGDEPPVYLATPWDTRVGLREGTKEKIRAAAPKTANGDYIDPNTGQVIPREGPFDYGHKPGFEWWRTQELARAEGWTREEIIEYENDPDHYQIEDPSANRGHQFELP